MATISTIPANQERQIGYSTSELIEALGHRGIRYFMVVSASKSNPIIDLPELTGRLAAHPEPRLREALIPLFIRTGNSSDMVKQALTGQPPQEREVIQHMYIGHWTKLK